MKFAVRLTVADHDQDLFFHAAVFRCESEADARAKIAIVDGLVDDESEPELETCNFSFILDLIENDNFQDLIDTGKRCLPLQVARQLAPDAIDKWLTQRPDDCAAVIHRPPVLDWPYHLRIAA